MIARIFFILLALFLAPCLSFASGKMVIGENQTIMLEAQSGLTNPEYKWALLQDGNIIDTQTGAYYSHLFPNAGSFTLNLTANSSASKEIENSQVEILVGSGVQFSNSLNIVLETFPKVSSENTLSLPENDLRAGFILQNSQGDIKEYHIDADIKIDSDGDGDTANDIDNQNDTSLYSGSLWLASYQKSQLPTQAKITVIDKKNEHIDQLVSLQIAPSIGSDKKLRAILETSPEASEDKQIHLQGDTANVYIFTGASEGKILEYRLDTNTAVDSDGDGNPANDIDNLTHSSFHSGGVFPLSLTRASGNTIVQLTVVGVGGKGSLVQKRILWDSSTDLVAQQNFRVYADTMTPNAGETVHFGLDGLLPGEQYDIKWDFNGDKSTDLEKSDGTASYLYEQTGTYNVLVQIKNEHLKLLKYATLPLQVQARSKNAPSTRAPISNFTYTQSSNKLIFTNTSSTDETLVNKEKKFSWDFGDSEKSSIENPTHVYKKIGNYIVRFKITDSAGLSHEKQILVEIKALDPKNQEIINPAKEASKEQKTETPKTTKPVIKEKTASSSQTSSSDFSFMSIFFFFIIIIATLLGAGALYLFIQKIRNPDYSFGEIIEEEKEKMLSILEGRPYEAPSGEILSTGKEVKEDIQGILKESDTADKIKKELQEEKPAVESTVTETVEANPIKTENVAPLTASQEQNATPPWMQTNEMSAPATSEESTSVVPNSDSVLDTDVPDWMKETTENHNSGESSLDSAQNSVPMPPSPPIAPMESPQTPPLQAQAPSTNDVNDDDIPDWLK